MAAQNIYDDPDFLAGYATLDRQVRGLDGAAEWPALSAMIPEVRGQRVLDLGCGFGWVSRWAVERGAQSVVGIDVSTKMLERAREETKSKAIEYRCLDLDELVLPADCCDIVFSSLTLHYVQNLGRLLEVLATATRPGGSLVFSVEHPIYSAPSTQSFETSKSGATIWPLENYLVEGTRVTDWFVDGVVKEHRTVASYINAVINAGFVIDRIEEWGPSDAQVESKPELAQDLHRPWFLLVQSTRKQAT